MKTLDYKAEKAYGPRKRGELQEMDFKSQDESLHWVGHHPNYTPMIWSERDGCYIVDQEVVEILEL